MKGLSNKAQERLLYLISPIGLMVLWQVLLMVGIGDRRFVPTPSDIAYRYWEMVASGDPKLHVLEGQWTLDGALSVERYRSMDDLLGFWNSAGYQEAKKLRAGLSQTNFIVAIEGR